MEKEYHFTVTKQDEGMRLDLLVARLLARSNEASELSPLLSQSKIRKLIQLGLVFINGTRCKVASRSVRAHEKIQVFLDLDRLKRSDSAQNYDQAFQIQKKEILFEDEFIILINKPYGLPTQPTLDRKRPSLYTLLIEYLSQREGLSGSSQKEKAYVGLHHRLDRDTSGVILFTKKKEANLGVSQIFKNRLAKKTYYAVVDTSSFSPAKSFHWEVGKEWRVENFLKKIKITSKKAKMKSVKSGGDQAITEFKVLRVDPMKKQALIEAHPLTGRMHQIRVHLSEMGLPIVGDPIYGRQTDGKRLMLHAYAIEFPHPITQKRMRVEAPLPKRFLEMSGVKTQEC